MHEEGNATNTLAEARQSIDRAFSDEEDLLCSRLGQLTFSPDEHRRIEHIAQTLSEGLTKTPLWQFNLNHLLHEYSLQTPEGIALLNIAEAYLRIPDWETKMRFLRDKLDHADWRAHIRPGKGFLINSVGRLMSYTQSTFQWTHRHRHTAGLSAYISHCIEATGSWCVEQFIQLIGRSFIMGRTLEEAQQKAKTKRPFVFSYDMLGEGALTENDALRNYLRYMNALIRLGRHHSQHGKQVMPARDNISIKLSSLFPGYHEYYAPRLLPRLLTRVSEICHLAAYYNLDVTIDAEESDNIQLTMDVMTALTADTSLSRWQGLGCAVQAYQKNATQVIDYLAQLAAQHHKKINVRLVKGAYWDGEIMQAQSLGLSHFPVYTQKVHTDVHYLLCAQQLLRHHDRLFPRFATHNAVTIAYLLTLAQQEHTEQLEFQSLYSSTGDQLYRNVLAHHPKHIVRFYAPIGIYPELLPYLVRRIIENGANSSFIQQLFDTRKHAHHLTETAQLLDKTQGRPHPQITQPQALFLPAWRNARGLSLARRTEQQHIAETIEEWIKKSWAAEPTHRDPSDDSDINTAHVHSPANIYAVIGKVNSTRDTDIAATLACLKTHQATWAERPATERALIVDRIADVLDEQVHALIALCVYEAGKTFPNAWQDWREAVDFCRYYAQCLRHDPALAQRQAYGIIATIAPWNFPIAIFTGQIVAALAMGNAVVAKASERTQLTGHTIITCMHKAGVPQEVLAFVTGAGTIGQALVAHPDVAGVVFTGSHATAQKIAETLYKKSPAAPLIAETGGLNAMMVDATALPEKVVKDILVSAFDSAGQRCSALRILCLQEEIADTIITMLFGALKEYHVGHPRTLSNHYGPVITQEAKKDIQEYVQDMKDKGFTIRQYGHLDDQSQGYYLLPTIIEVNHITDVTREVFGPVLHIVRYTYAERTTLMQQINDSGYHLTFGFQSRIQSDINEVIQTIRAGNIYINRSIIGAQVCSQPFGGDALSGTGPKAGGPLYLHRLGHLTDIPADQSRSALPYLAEQVIQWASTHLDETACQQLSAAYQAWPCVYPEQQWRVPTGELNTWHVSPKTPVMLKPANLYDFVSQMIACTMVGCHASIDPSAFAECQSLLATTPPALRSYFTITTRTEAEYLLISDEHPDFSRYQADATQASSALSPLITPVTAARLYDPWRLLHEQTVSINIAAIGANTDLMMMSSE